METEEAMRENEDPNPIKDLSEVLASELTPEGLDFIEAELLNREKADLSKLPVEKQYRIIADKVGQHENSILPVPGLSVDDVLSRKEEIAESDYPRILEENELLGKMLIAKLENRQLMIKVGVDPSGGEIHLGHGITLRMMRRFQQMGHKIQFVIGDATAMVGDSTDRKAARKALTQEKVKENMRTYTSQASRIIDLSPENPNVEVHYNSEWLNKPMMEWLPILQELSASRAMARKDFQSRIEGGGSVSLGELMYAAFMAYDSVHLKSDVEIGGLDQYLNFLQTRDLMAKYNLPPETILTVDLLPGTTGATDDQGRFVKMSKSLGNYIPLETEPTALYTKVMGIPDNLMRTWFRELTEISELELNGLFSEDNKFDPILLKRMLARVVVASLNNGDRDIALEAERGSMKLVGRQSELRPENATEIVVERGETVMGTLKQIGANTGNDRLNSNSNIRKLAQQQGVSILLGEEDDYVKVSVEMLNQEMQAAYIKVGKKNTFRIELQDSES